MNINFINGTTPLKKLYNVVSYASKPSFTSDVYDTFEVKSTSQSLDEVRKALNEAHNRCLIVLEQKRKILSKYKINDKLLKEDILKLEELRSQEEKYRLERGNLRKKLNYLNKKLDFEKHQNKNPRTAFLYNPDLSCSQIQEKIKLTEGLRRIIDLAEDLDTSHPYFQKLETEGIIETEKYRNVKYIDTLSEKNKPFFDKINAAREKGGLRSIFDLSLRYNYWGLGVAKAISRGELKLLGLEEAGDRIFCTSSYDSFLIDIDDPVNKEGIKKHLKLTPIQDEVIFNAMQNKLPPVSVNYLSRLGYGNVKEIINLIEKGYLTGYSKIKQTPNGKKEAYYVNLSETSNIQKLQNMRKLNRAVVDMKTYAKMLGVSKEQLKEMTLEGEIEIIPRYIFNEDYCKVFYNLNNPKNKIALDKKIFEKEIAINKIKEAKGDNSFRMKLVWYFAPKTREIAEKLAEGDFYIKRIIAKLEDDVALDDQEHIKLLSYYEKVWEKAGTEEYNEALKKALAVYNEYKSGGIQAIKDRNLKTFVFKIENKQE